MRGRSRPDKPDERRGMLETERRFDEDASSVETDDFKTDKKKKETKSTAPPETVSRFLFSFFFSFVVLNGPSEPAPNRV